ncbi:MAG: hypothetical protein K0U45_07965 [Alphaproteobacteria bacterium]|nr:hypothetical protein [Alphaproteobacteria bacterium]
MGELVKYIMPFLYIVEDKKTQISIAIGASVLYFIVAFITPHFIPLLEPDSYSYLDFSPIRTAFYPIFLDIMQAIGLSLNAITIVQLAVFSIILGWLIFHLMLFGLPLLLVVGFYLGMVGNIYLTAYHFSILTESISFSLVLLLMIYLLRFIHHKKTTDFLMMTIFAAIATAIKPAFLPFCVGILITNFLLKAGKTNWKISLKTAFLVGLLPIIFIIGDNVFCNISLL